MDVEHPFTGDFADANRRIAAYLAQAAARNADRERLLRHIAEQARTAPPQPGLDPDDVARLADRHRTQRDQLALLQQLAAAQAIAHDDLTAAGGRDNPEAVDRYRLATQRHIALLPRFET